MPKNFFVSVRQQTKIQLLDFIKANQDKPLTTVLGLFSLKTGYRIATLEIYVSELQDAGLINRD